MNSISAPKEAPEPKENRPAPEKPKRSAKGGYDFVSTLFAALKPGAGEPTAPDVPVPKAADEPTSGNGDARKGRSAAHVMAMEALADARKAIADVELLAPAARPIAADDRALAKALADALGAPTGASLLAPDLPRTGPTAHESAKARAAEAAMEQRIESKAADTLRAAQASGSRTAGSDGRTTDGENPNGTSGTATAGTSVPRFDTRSFDGGSAPIGSLPAPPGVDSRFDGNGAVVRMSDPELGNLSIRLTQIGEGLAARLAAGNETTAELLRASLPGIAAALAGPGANPARVTVASSSNGSANGDASDHAGRRHEPPAGTKRNPGGAR